VRRIGRHLGLDIEARRQGEHLGEARYAGAVHGLLQGKAPLVFRARTQPSDVVALQLLESEVLDERAGGGDPCTVGAARDVGVQRAIVMHHHHAVAGDPDVELQRRGAELQCPLEAGQRVLGQVAARAAVALNVQ